jgi:hypothetical protein
MAKKTMGTGRCKTPLSNGPRHPVLKGGLSLAKQVVFQQLANGWKTIAQLE